MTFSNISSKATGPMITKFHPELPWDGGSKVCSNCPGYMTDVAKVPIHCKNL